jgi:hypothetical protein
VFLAFSSPIPQRFASFSDEIGFLDREVFMAATSAFGLKQLSQLVPMMQLAARSQQKTVLL